MDAQVKTLPNENTLTQLSLCVPRSGFSRHFSSNLLWRVQWEYDPQGAHLLGLVVWRPFSSASNFNHSPSNGTLLHEARQFQNMREHMTFKWPPWAAFFPFKLEMIYFGIMLEHVKLTITSRYSLCICMHICVCLCLCLWMYRLLGLKLRTLLQAKQTLYHWTKFPAPSSSSRVKCLSPVLPLHAYKHGVYGSIDSTIHSLNNSRPRRPVVHHLKPQVSLTIH